MPPLGPTERLYVRLRRYTTMPTAHDHMEMGTAILWNIADALSRIVRQGPRTFGFAEHVVGV
jgi:hypothetical protein